MKKFNWIISTALVFLTACNTNANGPITWKEDGSVLGNNGKKMHLEIQGIYDSLEYADVSYLAGFKIDKEGNNFPHIAQVRNDLSSVQYWAFEHIPNDIFIYKETVHVITMDGEIYSLKGGRWNVIDKKFPRESQIVYSDNKENLIVCHPASMEKMGDYNSGCFSAATNWKLGFTWFNIVPKVCNGQLYIVEESDNEKLFKQVHLLTGTVVKSSLVKNVPDDICNLK
jgi:hypothetical protein